MLKRKNILIAIIIISFSLVLFMISYSWGINKLDYNKEARAREVTETDKTTSNITLGDTISKDTKIILKTKYKKSGDIETKELAVSEFIGKNKKDLEDLGYDVESISSNEVSLVKVVDSYAPNKFVLGVKGKCFAIYRTDEAGNLIIEEETDIEVPMEEDYELLLKGSKDFQFDSKEQAEEKLGEFIS